MGLGVGWGVGVCVEAAVGWAVVEGNGVDVVRSRGGNVGDGVRFESSERAGFVVGAGKVV
jgi:hypothetical protein